MVKAREIKNHIHWMGAVDWDRRLFDSLIPLPDGTSYNAYLIEGSEKVALLDTVDPTMTDVLMFQLENVPRIDYLVSHHAEQDHRPKAKFASVIGSYGWSTRVVEQTAELIPNLKVELLDPVLCEGYPREEDFQALDRLADAVAARHREEGLLG